MILHIPPFLELLSITEYFNLSYTLLIFAMALKTSILFRTLELFSPLNNQTSWLIMYFSKVKFTDPQKSDTLVLDFDPREQIIEVRQTGVDDPLVILEVLFPDE